MRKRENIDELLNANEGEGYQFKEWKNKGDLQEAAKILCALSNCGGGKFVIGISDERPRKVVGSQAFQQPERTRMDLMNKLRVRVDFNIYEHENRRVLVFDVAGRPIGLPVQTESGTWWYHGDSLMLMPEDVRLSIYDERSHDFSADICLKVTIDDIDDRAIENFRTLWIKNSENNRIATLSKEQILRDCGVITNEGVTNAALILFGKPAVVARTLPQAEIIFEYRSKEAAGPAAQREEFCEGFFLQSYDKIWELVNLRNDKQHYQDRFQMLPVPTFNEHVVREAVLNAVAHREYQLGGSIFVRQYSHRLVVESPGGFPKGVDAENIVDQQSPRNHLIAKTFQLCGLVERSGQGMNLIYEMTVKEAKPLPDFTGSGKYSVKLTLGGQVIHTNMLAMLKKTDKNVLDAITTADYVLLSKIYHGDDDIDLNPAMFKNLLDLGIAKKTELGIELVGGKLIVIVDEDDEKKRLKLTSVPSGGTDDGTEVGTDVKLTDDKLNDLLKYCETPRSRKEMQGFCGIKTDEYFRKNIIVPMLAQGLVRMTEPGKPKSRNQKYVRGDRE